MATATTKPAAPTPLIYVLELSYDEAQAIKDICGQLGTHELLEMAGKGIANEPRERIRQQGNTYQRGNAPVGRIYSALRDCKGIL